MEITNDAEYNAACDRIAILFDVLAATPEDVSIPEDQEFAALTLAVEEYEQQEADKVEALYEL